MRDLFDLSGRVAIVTGGLHRAEGVKSRKGWRKWAPTPVVLCARKKERCQQAAEELQQLGVKTLALWAEIASKNPADVQAVVDAAFSQFGRIDILVNNAGISWGAPVEEMSLEDWNKVIETNLTGTFLCAQAVGRVMIKQGRGKIINIASVAGLGGAPPELPAIGGYHASKGRSEIRLHAKIWRAEWAMHNIQVKCIIAPASWFPTHMSNKVLEHNGKFFLSQIPMRRFGNDHDLKGAAVFLASDASDYVTGHVLVVDGGQSAW